MTAIGAADYSLLMRQGTQFVNTCFGSNGNGSDEMQIAQAGLNLAFSIGEMLAMGADEKNKAKAETTTETKNAVSAADATKSSHDKTINNAMSQIVPQIQANIQKVQTLIEKMEQQTQEKQDREDDLQQITSEISSLTNIANDSSKPFSERKAALDKLGECNSQLTELGNQISHSVSEMENINGETEDITLNTQNLHAEGNNVVNTGVAEHNALQNQVVSQQTQVAATGVTGTVNVIEGGAAIATGEAMESNVVTAATGERLITNGTDREDAGSSVRIPDAARISSQLVSTAGSINTNLSEFSALPTAIGSLSQEGLNCGEQVMSAINTLSPVMMNAFQNVSDGSEQLQGNIDNGIQTLDDLAQNNGPEGAAEEGNDNNEIVDEQIIEELTSSFAA